MISNKLGILSNKLNIFVRKSRPSNKKLLFLVHAPGVFQLKSPPRNSKLCPKLSPRRSRSSPRRSRGRPGRSQEPPGDVSEAARDASRGTVVVLGTFEAPWKLL